MVSRSVAGAAYHPTPLIRWSQSTRRVTEPRPILHSKPLSETSKPSSQVFSAFQNPEILHTSPTSLLSAIAPPDPRRFLLSIDIDDTLIPWTRVGHRWDKEVLRRNLQWLHQHHQEAVIVLNTGRGLQAVKNMAPLLAGTPIDYLVTEHGQNLFVNHNHESTLTWLAKLQDSDADPGWQHILTLDYQWHTPTWMGLIRSSLDDLGWKPWHPSAALQSFIPTDTEYWVYQPKESPISRRIHNRGWLHPTSMVIGFDPQTPDLFLFTPLPSHRGQARVRLKELENALLQAAVDHQWPPPAMTQTHHQQYPLEILSLHPQGLHKGTVIESRILPQHPSVERTFTAGDSWNDWPAMLDEAFGLNQVPNTPIAVEEAPPNHPTIQALPTLYEGLTQSWSQWSTPSEE